MTEKPKCPKCGGKQLAYGRWFTARNVESPLAYCEACPWFKKITIPTLIAIVVERGRKR